MPFLEHVETSVHSRNRIGDEGEEGSYHSNSTISVNTVYLQYIIALSLTPLCFIK
jgi:hypothetical protein